MGLSFEQTIIEVWRQALVENAAVVEWGTGRFPVRRTPKRHLREVDFRPAFTRSPWSSALWRQAVAASWLLLLWRWPSPSSFFAAFLPADFSFLRRMAFFVVALRFLGMGEPLFQPGSL